MSEATRRAERDWGPSAASETDPLLPGEVLYSDFQEDAEHWTTVYGELLGFLLGSKQELPRETLELYRRRLAYWSLRRDELTVAVSG